MAKGTSTLKITKTANKHLASLSKAFPTTAAQREAWDRALNADASKKKKMVTVRLDPEAVEMLPWAIPYGDLAASTLDLAGENVGKLAPVNCADEAAYLKAATEDGEHVEYKLDQKLYGYYAPILESGSTGGLSYDGKEDNASNPLCQTLRRLCHREAAIKVQPDGGAVLVESERVDALTMAHLVEGLVYKDHMAASELEARLYDLVCEGATRRAKRDLASDFDPLLEVATKAIEIHDANKDDDTKNRTARHAMKGIQRVWYKIKDYAQMKGNLRLDNWDSLNLVMEYARIGGKGCDKSFTPKSVLGAIGKVISRRLVGCDMPAVIRRKSREAGNADSGALSHVNAMRNTFTVVCEVENDKGEKSKEAFEVSREDWEALPDATMRAAQGSKTVLYYETQMPAKYVPVPNVSAWADQMRALEGGRVVLARFLAKAESETTALVSNLKAIGA